MQRDRVINRDLHQVTEFSSLEDFVNHEVVPAGISTIYVGGIPIDILISPGSAKTTIFFFHGAIQPHFTLPVLSGLGISGGLAANRVFISDPSLVLDEKLMLSWYAGNEHQPDLQQDLLTIMEKIVTSLDSERTIFFGGSGGGFAALYFASYFAESLALVFNPQTDIAQYSRGAVRDYALRAFDINQDEPRPLDKLPVGVVTDLCTHYMKSRPNSVAYMQNMADKVHVEKHLTPFWNAVDADTEVFLLTDHWRDGHTPPPKELLSEILNVAVSATDWRVSLNAFGFRDHWESIP
ncbi:hypothetical protein [Enteractinococcus coprophilus]|uniref:Uncharacterized protein n=1 Tax=Enteractinococcus coprophilus TaxID=1027633 RepID=A0A543AGG8_9MICC|nr:hypothetical protein [Enteractinococcus coprophilus]TQL71678.1 hypothetical protein FB556_2171 [Enteractinococcus coprophilus]